MIVLDEHLQRASVQREIARWYRGAIVNLTDLRRHTTIKDEAVPTLLRTIRNPTFITLDVDGFWRKAESDDRFCIICFDLPSVRQVPPWLRRLLSLDWLRRRADRLGLVILASPTQIRYYTDRTRKPVVRAW